MSKSNYDIVHNIINKFDFELVHSYMVVSKWHWRGEKKAPSIENLKHTAESLLYEVTRTISKFDDDYSFSSTGGFKASYCKRCNEYRLEFILERKYISAD